MYHPILRSKAQQKIKKIGSADLVIGLPTYKNPKTAAKVASAALEGAHRYYPHLRVVLINADAGSSKTTRRAVKTQASENGHNSILVSGRYRGTLGHGSAAAALLDAALALDARAIILLDTHAEGMTAAWIAALAHLILENKAALVAPRYHQWISPTGALSDLIAYPLFRALWGHSVRHPAATDFALSPQLAAALLDEDIWGTAVASCGLMPWLTTYAILNGWRVAQTAVGEKWDNNPRRPNDATFKNQFHDILSVLFRSIYRHAGQWSDGEQVVSLPTLTQFATPTKQAIPLPPVETETLIDAMALGWMEYRLLWQKILTVQNLAQVERVATLPIDQFHFPAELWAKIIYDAAVVFNKGEADPVQIINSLFPLYQGRLAAFQHEIAGLAPVGREGTVAAQAVEFEELTPYLTRRWQTYRPGHN